MDPVTHKPMSEVENGDDMVRAKVKHHKRPTN